MRLTVLVDNNTLIEKYYCGEPGLSFYIEEGDKRILFDTGYSDLACKNAGKMGIDLRKVNTIVLSHGHLDHTWGLPHLMGSLNYYGKSRQEISLVAHPDALKPKQADGEQIGLTLSPEVLARCFSLKLSASPVWLTEKLVFLGEIARTHDFEQRNPLGEKLDNGVACPDDLIDDSALCYKSEKGLVLITGCAHAGICNTVDYARKVCNDDRIADIIGGFHLLNPGKRLLDGTVRFMEACKPAKLHACHCTDLGAKIALSKAAELVETGVGTKIQYK
jgi:7,8-dihydropterin-6-yl-methyl-4-(beta-D-ribofuranosyl)aminobenzene 5'-phosphate synthase